MHYVYLLKCRDGTLYCGYTLDLKRRERAHNTGRGSRYVKSRGGGKIVYSEDFRSNSKAMSREAQIKRLSHKSKLDLIARSRKAKAPR